jgi:hypothetical protein
VREWRRIFASVTELPLSWSGPTEFDGTTKRCSLTGHVAPEDLTPSATEERTMGSFWNIHRWCHLSLGRS